MPAAETKQNMPEMKMAFATPVEPRENPKIPVVPATEMKTAAVPCAINDLPYAPEVKSSAPQIPPLPTDQGETTNEASTQETKRPDKP